MTESPSFTIPRPLSAVGLILAVHVVVYLALVSGDFRAVVSAQTLLAHGALHLGALASDERWRLAAAPFLHSDPAQLALDLFALVLWGPTLERRVGCVNFLFIYFAAAVASSTTSVAWHDSAYLAFGAAGPLFGLLGALLALWALGEIRLAPTFFLVNLSLNFGALAAARRFDICAPVAGLFAGFLACLALDGLGRLNKRWLSCKFPELIRIWLLVLALGGAALVRLNWPGEVAWAAAAAALLVLVAVKAIDAALAVRRGLAFVVAALAMATAGLGYALAGAAGRDVAAMCKLAPPGRAHLGEVCATALADPLTVAALAGALAVVVGAGPFLRGLRDKGFVAASFRGERRRAVGL